MVTSIKIVDESVAWCFGFVCGCCFPKRKDHQGKGCFKRCGNPCRRIYKRCNECLGRPNYPPATDETANEVPVEEQQVLAVDSEAGMERV